MAKAEKLGLLASYAIPGDGDIEIPENASGIQGLLDYTAVPAKSVTSAIKGLLGLNEGPSLGERMALDTAFKQAVYDPQASPRQNMEAIRAASDKDLSADIAGGFVGAIKPTFTSGKFGERFQSTDGNWRDGVRFLRNTQSGEVAGILDHPEIGKIDVPWGEPGTGKSDGYGLSKLIMHHPEVVQDLPSTLAEMRLDPTRSTSQRAQLESADHKAAVKLLWDGTPGSWLFTAFKKDR